MTDGPSGEHTVQHIGADDQDLQAGEEVGEYVVSEKIGEGGFGTVFRAEHPLIGKQVAIKVLGRRYAADPEMVSRFVAEARAVNQIRHRNIIDIFSFGQLGDGRHYYIMELLAGRPLDEYLEASGPLPLDATIQILRGVARALDAAHGNGIAHRDLKPENIFLLEEEGAPPFPKLLDFGIAKLLTKEETAGHKTRTGAPIGTPMYMSPEQCRGKDVDHRTDIYAFGIVTYRMLTGAVPFDGEDFMDILLRQINDEPAPLSSVVAGLPPGVESAVAWMLKKNPSERPPNLVTAVRALEGAAAEAGIALPQAPAPSAVYAAQTVPGGIPSPTAPGALATARTATHTPLASAAPGTAKSRLGLFVLFALVTAGAIAAAVWMLVPGGQVESAAVKSKAPPVEKAAPETPQPTPPKEPDAPRYVSIQVTGVPAGTEVYGPRGIIGVAPGKLQLERSDESIQLTFKATGHEAATREVSVSQDGELEIELQATLKPNVRRKKPRKKRSGASKNSRNTTENPF